MGWTDSSLSKGTDANGYLFHCTECSLAGHLAVVGKEIGGSALEGDAERHPAFPYLYASRAFLHVVDNKRNFDYVTEDGKQNHHGRYPLRRHHVDKRSQDYERSHPVFSEE